MLLPKRNVIVCPSIEVSVDFSSPCSYSYCTASIEALCGEIRTIMRRLLASYDLDSLFTKLHV